MLFGPSPETSIAWRAPAKPLPSNSVLAKASAPEIEVPWMCEVGAALSAAAKPSALAWPSTRAPGDHHLLRPRPRPFHIGHGDAAVDAAADGRDHLGMEEGLHIAAALQRPLALVHRAGDIHRQHQLEIDRRLVGGRRRGQSRAAMTSAAAALVSSDRTQRHRQTLRRHVAAAGDRIHGCDPCRKGNDFPYPVTLARRAGRYANYDSFEFQIPELDPPSAMTSSLTASR